MFYYLKGELTYNDGTNIVIDCGGVGYLVTTSANSAAALILGATVKVYTYMAIRQDSVDIFGFISLQELATFKSLISVTGVGPKVGITILSALSPERFAMAVMSGDTHTITQAQGVGPKLAQRIVLELKDKVDASLLLDQVESSTGLSIPVSGSAEEAVKALIVLGYSRYQAGQAVKSCDGSLPVEDIVRAALRLLMK